MSKIISSKDVESYNIERFSFDQIVTEKQTSDDFSQKEPSETTKSQDCEELLKKIEELSSEVVTFQMKLEEQEKDFDKRILEVKDSAFKEGLESASKELQNDLEDLKMQYISSVTALQELDIQIKEKLSQFEEELIETSIIISTKVINKEVEENSSEIAKSITRYLLADIKDALEVRLLVNPVDFEELLKENLDSSIKIISDNSVKRGGVILLSGDKNIDSTIETRFKKTLQLIKES